MSNQDNARRKPVSDQPSTATVLRRECAPATTRTAVFGHPNSAAKSTITASFARPFSGGACTANFRVSPIQAPTAVRLLPGATFTFNRPNTRVSQPGASPCRR